MDFLPHVRAAKVTSINIVGSFWRLYVLREVLA